MILICCVSCDDFIYNDTPKTQPLEVYDAFIGELKNRSSYLQYIPNADSLFEAQRRLIRKKGTGEQLVKSFNEIQNVLKDANTGLIYSTDPENLYIFYSDWMYRYPENKVPHITHYFESYNNQSKYFKYGRLSNENIGYIKINTFLLGRQVGVFENIIKSFKGTDGLIIDLRSTFAQPYHSMGYDDAGDIIEFFRDSSRIYLYKRTRKPSFITNFTEWQEMRLPDLTSLLYSKPIIVLTNRKTKDAAEFLTAALRSIPTTTVIGDTTAGFIGYPAFNNLAGHWYMQIYHEEYKLPEDNLNVSKRFQGIPPDIRVNISAEDSLAGIDTILEAAIDRLSISN